MKGQKGKNVFTYEEIERKECVYIRRGRKERMFYIGRGRKERMFLHMKKQKGKNVLT